MPDKNQSITDVISNIGDLIKSGKGDKKAAKRFRERNTVTTPSKGFSLSDPLQGIDVKGELETAKPGVEKAFLKDKGDEPVKHVGDYGTVPTPSEGFSFNPTLGLPTSEPGTTDDPGDVSHGDPSNPFQGQRPEMEFLRPEFRDAGSQTSLKQKDPTTIQGAMARYDILSQGRLTNGVDPTPDRKAFEAKVRGWMDKGVWNEGHAHEVFASQFGGDFNQKLNEFGVATNTDQRVAPPRGIDRDEGAKDFSLMQVPGKLAEGVLDTTIAGYMGLDAENPEDMAKLEGLKNTDAYRLTHGLVELGSYVAMPGGMAKGIAGGGGMEGLMNLTPEKIKENPVGAATGVLGNIPQLSPLANLANKVYDPKTKTVDFGRADWVDYTLATIGLGVAAHPFVEGPIKESIAVRKTAMRLNEMFPEITPAEARTIAMSANRFGKWAEKGEFDKMREYLSDPKNAHLFDIYGKMRDRMTKMQGEQTWQNWSSGKNPGWGFNWDEKHRSPNDPAKDVGDEIKQEKYNAERENAKDAWEGTDKNPSEPSTPPALPGRQGKPPRPVEDILRELGANGEVTLGPEDKGQDLSHITKLITSGEYQVERKDDGTLRIFKAGGASPVAAQTSEPAVQPTEPTPTTEQTPTNTQPTEESSLPTQPETKPTEPSTQWPQDTPGTVRKVMGRDATSVSTFDGNDGIRYTLYQTRDGGIVHARDLGTGDTTDLRHWPDFEQAKREFGTTMRIAGDAFNPDAGNPTTGTPDTPGSSNNGPGVVDEEKKPKADVSEPKAEEPSEPAAPKEDTPEPEKKPVAPKLQQKGPDLELVPDAEPPKAGSRHFTEYSPSIIDHYHDWKPAPDYNDSLSDIQETKGGKEFNPRDYTVVEGKRKGDGKPAFGIKHPNGGFTFLGHGELDNDGDPYVSVDHIHDAIIAAQEEADAEDKKNNPAAKHPGMKFKVGDRVKFNDGQHQFSGRTGTVTKATPETIGWQKARIHIGRGGVGAEPIETDYSHYQKYSVKTDQGAEHDNVDETMIGSHDAEADSTLAPDPELDEIGRAHV